VALALFVDMQTDRDCQRVKNYFPWTTPPLHQYFSQLPKSLQSIIKVFMLPEVGWAGLSPHGLLFVSWHVEGWWKSKPLHRSWWNFAHTSPPGPGLTPPPSPPWAGWGVKGGLKWFGRMQGESLVTVIKFHYKHSNFWRVLGNKLSRWVFILRRKIPNPAEQLAYIKDSWLHQF